MSAFRAKTVPWSMVLASYDASVLPDGRRLGIHLPLATGMVKAADRAMTVRGSRARTAPAEVAP